MSCEHRPAPVPGNGSRMCEMWKPPYPAATSESAMTSSVGVQLPAT